MNEVEFLAKGQVIKGQPITTLQLGRRASNVLQRGKIFTLDDLVEKWAKIGLIRNCGAQTVREIHSEFFAWYMEQIDNTPEWPSFINSLKGV